MAPNTPPEAATTATSANGALVAAMAATPENTPLPGGGSWHWDTTLPGWVENAPPIENTLAPQLMPAAVAPAMVQQPSFSTFEPTQE